MANRWLDVEKLGQSLWYDNLGRSFIASDKLPGMIRDLGLRGITSNPAIFERSISEGREYDADIERCVREGMSTTAIYDRLTTDDVRAAADVMRSVFDRTEGLDGYVSIEVDPRLANDTHGTLEAARRLWAMVGRPNVMIKIPGTPSGIPAIRTALREGININVTLLFGIENYAAVAEAYIDALKERERHGESVSGIASVASFFLSRVDTNVDKLLQAQISAGNTSASELLGKAAVANARLAFERYHTIFSGEAWASLAAKGARTQRCLWASVSTKNPAYRDVMYIEPLIGPNTVTTVPDDTIAAFADHGVSADTLGSDMAGAHAVIDQLKALGIDTERVAEELQIDGVQKFIDAFNTLIAKLDAKRAVIEGSIG